MHRPLIIVFVVLALLSLGGVAAVVLTRPAERITGNATTNVPVASCTSDADCIVAGCSSQLCVRQGTEPPVSTCEYSNVYACVKLTTCGCHQGSCAWNPTTAYTTCVQNAKK